MTDHKAEWVLVPRVATEAMLREGCRAWTAGVNHMDALQLRWEAMLAAAPAASEGEDEAVATVTVDAKPGFQCIVQQAPAVSLEIGTKLYTRPAAQVAATPKHDEGLLPCPFCGKSGAFDQWPCEWLDASGANVVRCAWCHGAAPMQAWNRRALATQPAARRVTDGPLAQPLKAEWTPDCSGKQDFDADLIALSTRYWPRGGGYLVVNGGVVYDNDSRPEELPSAKASILAQGDKIASAYFEADSEAEVKAQVEQWATRQWDRIRSALAESFAQPAEGVPRKKHDGPCWRNSHADCGC